LAEQGCAITKGKEKMSNNKKRMMKRRKYKKMKNRTKISVQGVSI
jgi:hypothetical protein